MGEGFWIYYFQALHPEAPHPWTPKVCRASSRQETWSKACLHHMYTHVTLTCVSTGVYTYTDMAYDVLRITQYVLHITNYISHVPYYICYVWPSTSRIYTTKLYWAQYHIAQLHTASLHCTHTHTHSCRKRILICKQSTVERVRWSFAGLWNHHDFFFYFNSTLFNGTPLAYYIPLSLYLYIYIPNMYVYIYIYIHKTHIHIYIYIYIHIYVCMYTIYTYMCDIKQKTYIYIYIYIYIPVSSHTRWERTAVIGQHGAAAPFCSLGKVVRDLQDMVFAFLRSISRLFEKSLV